MGGRHKELRHRLQAGVTWVVGQRGTWPPCPRIACDGLTRLPLLCFTQHRPGPIQLVRHSPTACKFSALRSCPLTSTPEASRTPSRTFHCTSRGKSASRTPPPTPWAPDPYRARAGNVAAGPEWGHTGHVGHERRGERCLKQRRLVTEALCTWPAIAQAGAPHGLTPTMADNRASE